MDLKTTEEGKSGKTNENNEPKSKMVSISSEGTEIKNTKISGSNLSKTLRSRSKTTNRPLSRNYNGRHSNIPQPITMIRSKSCDKNAKIGNNMRKLDEKDDKKYIKTKSAFDKYKSMTNNENPRPPKNGGPNVPYVVGTPGETPVKEEQNATIQNKEYSGFTQLLPLCEKELKKIEDVWLNSIYCSLSTRANLIKLLFQECPNLDKGQFDTETEKLAQCFDEAKACTQSEIENLIKLVESLLATREKAKKEIAQISGTYNDVKNKTETDDESKLLKDPKKEENMDPKKGGFLSFFSFGRNEANNQNNLRQKETAPKNQSSTNDAEEKDGSTKCSNLSIVQKEFDELKRKYSAQNTMYERKIQDLETLLEEKSKILKQEKEVKNQLQACLSQFQAQQKRLSNSLGYERLEFLLGRSFYSRNKRREEVWVTAIRLIVKGFFLQIKNLEAQRNKMLFQLHANDIERLSALAISAIQKENFLYSVKQQMRSYHTAYKKIKTENKTETEKNNV